MMVMEMMKRENKKKRTHKDDAQNPFTFTAATREILFKKKKKNCTEEEPQHKNDLDSGLGGKNNKIK